MREDGWGMEEEKRGKKEEGWGVKGGGGEGGGLDRRDEGGRMMEEGEVSGVREQGWNTKGERRVPKYNFSEITTWKKAKICTKAEKKI